VEGRKGGGGKVGERWEKVGEMVGEWWVAGWSGKPSA